MNANGTTGIDVTPPCIFVIGKSIQNDIFRNTSLLFYSLIPCDYVLNNACKQKPPVAMYWPINSYYTISSLIEVTRDPF